MTGLRLSVAIESWPLLRPFVIARGAKTEARVVVAALSDGRHIGRGECVPYARYGETPESVAAELEAVGPIGDREALAHRLAPGAARNAYDCAIWDLHCKRLGRRAADLAGIGELLPLHSCYTLSLDTPEAMAKAAVEARQFNFLKLKLGGDGDVERMRAVRTARPDARLIADANEAWTPAVIVPFLEAASEYAFELVEQPLPAGQDDVLAHISRPLPVCADESAHTSADLPRLVGRYDAVNIKLDKTGGATEAFLMAKAASELGFQIMVGCMVATSLAMAPAFLVAQRAHWVDLDGPLLLARDRPSGLRIEHGVIQPPLPELWG